MVNSCVYDLSCVGGQTAVWTCAMCVSQLNNGIVSRSKRAHVCGRHGPSDDSWTRDTTSVRDCQAGRHEMTSWMSRFGSFAAEVGVR